MDILKSIDSGCRTVAATNYFGEILCSCSMYKNREPIIGCQGLFGILSNYFTRNYPGRSGEIGDL